MSATAAKVCIICKKDCSNLPRVKDPQGNYCCKTCNDALLVKRVNQATKAKPLPPEPAPVFDDGELDMAALAGQVTQTAPPEVKTPCPGCGAAMGTGDVICTACGLNIMTGKKGKSKCTVIAPPPGESGPSTAGKVAGTLFGANPAAWALGGVVGGGIGAAAWAFIIKSTGLEIGWIAWGVGVLTGIGVVAVARERAGALSGTIALVIAVAAMGIGRYAGISMINDADLASLTSPGKKGEDFTIVVIALQLEQEANAHNKSYRWPYGKSRDNLKSSADLPPELRQEALAKWHSLTESQREQVRAGMSEALQGFAAENMSDINTDDFWGSMRPIHALIFFLGIASAYTVGSGGQKF